MPVIQVIAAVVTAVAVGLISVHLFFKDGDDATRSMEKATEPRWDGYGKRFFFFSRFNLWVTVSIGAGVAVFHWFPVLLKWFSHW